VLTSTDVLLMSVTTRSEAVDATVGPVGARVLLSWRHYRGAEDFTLSISVSMLEEDCMYTTSLYFLRLIVWQTCVCYCTLD
jgi:hypothetical protein